MSDPTQCSPPAHPVGEPVPRAGTATGATDEPADEPGEDRVPTEAAARAAADVTLLLSRAAGLRRAVELAERSRRDPDAHGRG